MNGTFVESIADAHVELRATMLSSRHHPSPDIPIINHPSASGLDPAFALLEASLTAHGLAIVQMDEPLSTEQFACYARRLGLLVPEHDEDVQPFVEQGDILHLRTRFGPTDRVGLQPFSSSPLSMHSESSGNALADQPRYLAFQCLEPGEFAYAPQTLLIDMATIVARLSPYNINILARTYYDSKRNSPPLLRYDGQRWVISFRDFQQQPLSWVHEGPTPAGDVLSAIRDLLACMYTAQASAVRWARGMFMVFDNQRYMHARSKGHFVPDQQDRHLVRARIRSRTPDLNVPAAVDDGDSRVLFARPASGRIPQLSEDFRQAPAVEPNRAEETPDTFIDERTLDVFSRALNPTNPMELRDLWLGRVEAELGGNALRPEYADLWRRSRVRRAVSAEEVLRSTATVGMVKELFNAFFRDDLYGALSSKRNIILSSGAVDEDEYGLPAALKETLRFALARNFYGYSDSLGRQPAREAVAAMESASMQQGHYEAASVALTMGATHTISSLADFIFRDNRYADAAICAIPNYPPLVQSIAWRHPVRLVPTPSYGGTTSLQALSQAVTPNTPMVLLQTGTNPCGSLVDELELERFIQSTSLSTLIILDECHEWLGAPRHFSPARQRANVIRVSSLSKNWSVPGLKVGWFLADPAFVSRYYEFASTSYGGPQSFVYTLVEVLARFERWIIEGRTSIDQQQLREFSASYGLQLGSLSQTYEHYVAERRARERVLLGLRGEATSCLRRASMIVKTPRCSINVFAQIPGSEDSYLSFRSVLRETGVSVYPGILSFYLAGGGFRVTTARKWGDLHRGLERLSAGAWNA